MVYQGTVQDGVVVLAPGTQLPDGTMVRVESIAKSVADPDRKFDIVYMGDLGVDTGIPDLATNMDHYLYGHPLVTDAL